MVACFIKTWVKTLIEKHCGIKNDQMKAKLNKQITIQIKAKTGYD